MMSLDLSGGSTDEYHPAGMDALEVLQNQLQLLVCPFNIFMYMHAFTP